MDTVKRCSRCKEEKALEQFNRDRRSRDGHGLYCKPCKSECDRADYQRHREERLAKFRAYKKAHPEYSREWYANNREYANEKRKRHYEKSKDHVWAQNMWAKYRIRPAEYEALLVTQGGGCAICGRVAQPRRRLPVDHCHDTGTIRGILCDPCNQAIGLAEENPARLEAMILYLRKHGRG